MNELTIVIPAKNEAESLPDVLKDLVDLNVKIIVSLPPSDEKTIDSIKKFNIKIHKQTYEGYGNSLVEAINICDTEYFCIFNADGSFDKNDLKKMYDLIFNYEFIYTSRYLKNGSSDDDTIITYVGNRIFSFLGQFLFSLEINDILYTYLMGKTKSFNNLNIKSNDFRFCVELPIKSKRNGMKFYSIAAHEKKRIAGKKKVNEFRDGFLLVAGTDRSIGLREVAVQSYKPGKLPPDIEPGLGAVYTYEAGAENFPNGCHVCEV